MRIWLINSAEPTALEEDRFRLRRMGLLAQMASDTGHNVTWWNSTFLHATKSQRFGSDRTIEFKPNYRLHFLHAPAYSRNVSLARVRNHVLLGRAFARAARQEVKPDIILCSLPTLELCDEAVRYGRENCVPTVLDVRDLWPDAMLDLVPRWARAAGRLSLAPYFRMARRACAGATAICGNTDEFVSWGLTCGQRQKSPLDRSFPFGYSRLTLSADDEVEAMHYWHTHGVAVDPGLPIVCFFGSLNHQFDLDTVLEAARRIQVVRPVQFVLCGEGEKAATYRQLAGQLDNVILPGWVNARQIWWLMARSSFGLAPYGGNASFLGSLSNKPIEYLAGGLPILCSLSCGPLYELVMSERCGIAYHGSADQLSGAILNTLSAPLEHAALAANARRVFAQRFHAANVYGCMLSYLAAIATESSASYHHAPAD
jgi:glycosyltransferase involved in cell wall biosynthesis